MSCPFSDFKYDDIIDCQNGKYSCPIWTICDNRSEIDGLILDMAKQCVDLVCKIYKEKENV